MGRRGESESERGSNKSRIQLGAEEGKPHPPRETRRRWRNSRRDSKEATWRVSHSARARVVYPFVDVRLGGAPLGPSSGTTKLPASSSLLSARLFLVYLNKICEIL